MTDISRFMYGLLIFFPIKNENLPVKTRFFVLKVLNLFMETFTGLKKSNIQMKIITVWLFYQKKSKHKEKTSFIIKKNVIEKN